MWFAERRQKAQDVCIQCWIFILCAQSTGALQGLKALENAVVLGLYGLVRVRQVVLTASDDSRAVFGLGQTPAPADCCLHAVCEERNSTG